MKGFIRINSLWDNEESFGVRINASNGQFSGIADCYSTRDDIKELATLLTEYPRKIDSVVEFTTGESDNMSFFSLKFFCVDHSGHILVRVKMCHHLVYSNGPSKSEHYMAEFDIPVEPWSIDQFVKTLMRVANDEVGGVLAELQAKN